MRQITTHKVNGCNEAITIDTDERLTIGGAPASYWIRFKNANATRLGNGIPEDCEITYGLGFQDGPIAEVGTNGLTHEALLAVIIDRLQSFQRGQYACRENALALTKLEEAMHWLHHRTRERVARGVEGTHAK